MHLLGRNKGLHIYAHEPLKEIINVQLSASNTNLNYPLFFHILPKDEEKILFKDNNVEISNFLLDHTIDCSGFLFKEISPKRRIIKEKIDEYNVPYDKIDEIKNGADYVNENNQIIYILMPIALILDFHQGLFQSLEMLMCYITKQPFLRI
jgi:ribonuclease Z